MVTFPVDDVPPATDRLPTRALGELCDGALAVGGDPGLPVLEPDGMHPLLSAVGRAFAQHRPLVLSPDAVWLTIAQGVAQHVRLNAERLRPALVRHTGRKRLTVPLHGPMPRDAASWGGIVDAFTGLLGAEIRDPGLFECDFSTSTGVERTAGRIVLLDAYSAYFGLQLVCVCGIPSVTLTGTAADWRRIRERVDAIAALDPDLRRWCRSLAPIADQFVRAAAGDPDTAFWRRIYSPLDAYGGDVVTGWVARLYPYLMGDGAQDRPNPLLRLPLDEPRDVPAGQRPAGIRTDTVPATLSRVTVTVTDLTDADNRLVALHAGVAAVAQDADGALRPVAGWHLAPATRGIDEVLDRILDDHEPGPEQPLPPTADVPADLVAVCRRLGATTLFGGAWRLPFHDERRTAWWAAGRRQLVEVAGLADGRSICAVPGAGDTVHWALCRLDPPEDPDDPDAHHRPAGDPADVPLLGTSLAVLLDAAADSGGDVDHLATGRLADLARA
ncbi:DUF4419 domain-containing protein [Spirilliplanes yamanashiensis]|uniref:DUF4419 domain-containing protein n=1 Tax=Spirilliplanes yamanashiensis TaxID=42233 RepID=A0A8J4DKY7_9ACTN|nr:DUF4419 domain-containing protein [Spirilliplanes yamanashiensis]MDP9818971.1 hypothetical protein [Spirilliplanes yamanashiensis]GIJ05426.1 hypothetical protein Sya03_47780 [Spirilliplanes yamanashiensis]